MKETIYDIGFVYDVNMPILYLEALEISQGNLVQFLVFSAASRSRDVTPECSQSSPKIKNKQHNKFPQDLPKYQLSLFYNYCRMMKSGLT